MKSVTPFGASKYRKDELAMPWTFFNSSGESMVTHAESEATQAEMEAQTAVAHFVPPDLVKNSPGVAKAYCHITNAAGAPATGSYNITSGAKNGTGDYTMTYTTSFSSTNYTAIAAIIGGDSRTANVQNLATGTCDVFTFNSNADETKEVSDAMFVAFGDQ